MCCVVSVLISDDTRSFMTRISSGLSCGGKERFPCLTPSDSTPLVAKCRRADCQEVHEGMLKTRLLDGSSKVLPMPL